MPWNGIKKIQHIMAGRVELPIVVSKDVAAKSSNAGKAAESDTSKSEYSR